MKNSDLYNLNKISPRQIVSYKVRGNQIGAFEDFISRAKGDQKFHFFSLRIKWLINQKAA